MMEAVVPAVVCKICTCKLKRENTKISKYIYLPYIIEKVWKLYDIYWSLTN